MTQAKRAWKAPVEVPLTDIPGRLELTGKYAEFLRDVELRLTQTANAAILYEFADEKTAELHGGAASNGIRQKRGNGSVRTVVRGAKLYIWRGKTWQ